MSEMSVLLTERLRLRPFRDGDAEAMFRNWTNDEEVARFCRWYRHKELKSTKWLLDLYLREAAEGFDHRWGITLLENDDEVIGSVEVVGVKNHDQNAEIGYVMARRYWNKGYTTEAVKAVIEELFRCGYTVVCGRRHTDNPASGRVMEKCGMHFTGMDREVRKYTEYDMCDVMVYEIVRDDNKMYQQE